MRYAKRRSKIYASRARVTIENRVNGPKLCTKSIHFFVKIAFFLIFLFHFRVIRERVKILQFYSENDLCTQKAIGYPLQSNGPQIYEKRAPLAMKEKQHSYTAIHVHKKLSCPTFFLIF